LKEDKGTEMFTRNASHGMS